MTFFFKKKTILVTGGAGYIGSHTVSHLHAKDYSVVILDNLLHGQEATNPCLSNLQNIRFVVGDFGDKDLLHKLFKEYNFYAIIHFAASIEVSESCKDPALYYHNNVTNTQKLLDVARFYGVVDIVFSSSCAVYGKPQTELLCEDHPKNPISPYGRTKYIVEEMLQDYANAYGLCFIALRYFNAAGGFERHEPETHVIPRLVSAAAHDEEFSIFGTDYATQDGSAIRDYVSVYDLANAHVKALEYLKKTSISGAYNVGTGKGFSVLELVSKVQELVGKSMSINYCDRREGDPAVLVADSKKIMTDLQWVPTCSDLDTIIKSALANRRCRGCGGCFWI